MEDLVDFLRRRNIDRRLTQAATKLSEKAFQKVWDNPDDADCIFLSVYLTLMLSLFYNLISAWKVFLDKLN